MTPSHNIQNLSSLEQLQQYQNQYKDCRIGLVPTMGNLHSGHLSLVETVAAHCDKVMVSIFVNPAQFSPQEDFASYPRTLEKDIALLANTACSAIFIPKNEEIYPSNAALSIYNLQNYPDVEPLSKVLCGVSRPHFFDGVVKVVCRLFELVQPYCACFGEKDYQQLLILQKITAKLFPTIKILSSPTKRNAKKLALSSRNNYFDAEQLEFATQLPNCMKETVQRLVSCQSKEQWQIILKEAKKHLEKYFSIDYFEVRDNDDLQLVESPNAKLNARLFAAVYLQDVRLIDNNPIT
jgi:pantoate--beta-alanine ligase